MKAFFEMALFYVKKHWAVILCVAIAVRQLIIWDWFGAIISAVVAGIIFLVNLFKK